MLLAADSATSSSNDASDDSSSSDSSLDSGDEVTAVPTGPTVADPSVIVGMACRVAGVANPSELWKAIAEKKDSQRKMPDDRFNVDAFYHPSGANKGTTNAKYGYYLDRGLDLFDNEFFKISGKEAEAMDPQQRILLEVVYEALEDGKSTLDCAPTTLELADESSLQRVSPSPRLMEPRHQCSLAHSPMTTTQ